MYTISFWPILVSAVVAFVIGALWYSPVLFGKEWMGYLASCRGGAAGSASGMWQRYLVQIVMTLIMFVIMGFAVSASGSTGTADGALVGFLAWLGFMLPTAVTNVLWKEEPFKISLIETVNNLVILVIGGAIIGAWH